MMYIVRPYVYVCVCVCVCVCDCDDDAYCCTPTYGGEINAREQLNGGKKRVAKAKRLRNGQSRIEEGIKNRLNQFHARRCYTIVERRRVRVCVCWPLQLLLYIGTT